MTSRPRLMISTWSTVCATSASTWLEIEHRATLRGERAQEVAQPAHALRVEPVGGLVEDEQLRLAEQRRREPESLAHAERVALDAAPCRILRARRGAAPRRRASRARRRPGRASAGGHAPSGPGGSRWPRAPRRSAARDARAPRRAARTRAPSARRRCARPSSIRSVVVLPAPLGPRKPVIVPGSSANDRSSTASTCRSASSATRLRRLASRDRRACRRGGDHARAMIAGTDLIIENVTIVDIKHVQSS